MPGTYALRMARPEDDAELFALHAAAAADYPPAIAGEGSQQSLRSLWDARQRDNIRVIEVAGAIRGFIDMVETPEQVEICEFVVDGALRGGGLGTAILRDIARGACPRPVVLSVLKTLPRARSLYERAGFVPIGETRLRIIMRREPIGC